MLGRRSEERRRVERLVPAHPVRIEAEAESLPFVAGEARDLSRGGACLALDADFAVGDELIFKLLFERHGNPVPATGRIAWRGSWRRRRGLCGVQWTHTGPQRIWLDWLART